MSYLPILTYHRLLSSTEVSADPNRIAVTESQFRGHLQLLHRLGYRTLGLDAYAKLLAEGKPVSGRVCAISFDDGYEEVLTRALPVLQEFQFTATVFAVPGELGGHNRWDHGNARLLSREQYRTLRRSGIAIGAHTCTHVHLPQVSRDVARHEIQDSKNQLEDLLGEPVTTLAYPYGESNEAIENLVREAGYVAAFATDRAPGDHQTNRYRLRRVVIFPRTTRWELLWKAQRWYPAYQDRLRTWRS